MKSATTLTTTATLLLATSALAFAPTRTITTRSSSSALQYTTEAVESDAIMSNDEALFTQSTLNTFDVLADAYTGLVELDSGSAAHDEPSMIVQLAAQERELALKLESQQQQDDDDFYFPEPTEESTAPMKEAMREATTTMFESDGLMMVERATKR